MNHQFKPGDRVRVGAVKSDPNKEGETYAQAGAVGSVIDSHEIDGQIEVKFEDASHLPRGTLRSWLVDIDRLSLVDDKPVEPAAPLPIMARDMTLHDWFAGQALAGIMANPERWKDIAKRYADASMSYEQASQSNATKAYSLANAMMERRYQVSDTPRTDALFEFWNESPTPRAFSDHASQLERELTAAQADVDKWRDEYNRMRQLIAKQNEDISQTCGKALGYPWFKDDQNNFPGATEAQGVCVGEHVAETIAAELADAYKAAQAEIAKLQERVKMLEEALNVYLQAGHKQARREASVIAKAALTKAV